MKTLFAFLFFLLATCVSAQSNTSVVNEEKCTCLKDSIYTDAQKFPEPAGGWTEWENYLQQKVRTGLDSLHSNARGQVLVSCVIDENGTVCSAELKRGIVGETAVNNLAIQIVQDGGKWIPGTQGDKNVCVRRTVRVTF